MLKLEYHSEGALCSDFNAMEFAESLWNSTSVGEQHVKVGSWMVIDAARVLITKGIIPHDKLLICYDGVEMSVNEYAVINEWTADTPDFNCSFAEQILTFAVNKRKSER